MRTFYSLSEFSKFARPAGKSVISIGVFDGVHRGHQKIIKTVVGKAKARGFSSVLVTFHPHPATVLNPSKKVPLLISLPHRLRLLEEMGLDYTLVLHFDRKLSQMSARRFIEKILGKISVSEIVVGSNFLFGRGGSGSLTGSGKPSRIHGYKVSRIDTLTSSGKVISSTWIRSLILAGRLGDASGLLSRPVTVLGTVMKGEKRGRIIGYPTANINPHHEAIPPSGVYAVKIKFSGKIYHGILNIGMRPTFDRDSLNDREPTIEAHIFNFHKMIYTNDIEVIFVKKLRKEKRFKDTSTLKKQIKKDEIRAKHIFCHAERRGGGMSP
ncbi:MAG: bifunctional riboflavin kinase/FAD synthetase [Omnitrophica bacterium]|nr:bifunctional riboflavin kinase/FAD synthetase [Candidatus Omnitrophota bacterium]